MKVNIESLHVHLTKEIIVDIHINRGESIGGNYKSIKIEFPFQNLLRI